MNPCVRVRFITCDGFVSAAIRWVNNSLWSHVEFGTPEGTWIGAHTGDGVQERPANYSKPTREAVYEIPVTPAVMDAHLTRIRSQIGMRYDNLNILGLLIRKRKLESPHAVICSQFVSNELLCVFGPYRYLNVLAGFTHLVTPEMCHLSPLFVGHRVEYVDHR